MLYLMLVIVFSRLIKKWWIFLLIGYGRLCRLKCNNQVVNSSQYSDHFTVKLSFCNQICKCDLPLLVTSLMYVSAYLQVVQ